MPSVSKKQHNLMALVANDPKAAKRLGISQKVGREFMKADKGHKFGSGGSMKESKAMMRKEVAFMKKKGAPKSMVRHEEEEMRGGGKGKVKKFSGGRLVPNPNVVNPNIRVVPGLGPQYKGPYQTPVEMRGLAQRAKYLEMSPHKYEKWANSIIRAGLDAPAAIKAAAKAAARSGMIKGGIGGTVLGAVGKGLYDQFTMPEDNSQLSPAPEEGEIKNRKGGKIQSHKASKGPFRHAADGVAHKGKTKGHVVKMREGGMAYSEGGSVYRKGADGIASKGKTKGKMVKMRYGGEC